MNKSNGLYLEKLVEAIEKSIDPNSRVIHDVNLPDLNSKKGRKTQCDIVIYSGSPPREMMTIVEVQDRSSKPTANDFRGWIRKKEEVGAHRLICVSKKGFTATQEEKAQNSGNTIQLIQLSEIGFESIPIDFFGFKVNLKEFKVLNILNIKYFSSLEENKEEIDKVFRNGANIESQLYSYDKTNIFSLLDIARSDSSHTVEDDKGIKRINIPLEEKEPLFIKLDSKFAKIGLTFDVDWGYEVIHVPFSMMSYELSEHGVLAWVLLASVVSSKGTLNLRIPVVKNGDIFQLSNMSIDVPENLDFSFKMTKSVK